MALLILAMQSLQGKLPWIKSILKCNKKDQFTKKL